MDPKNPRPPIIPDVTVTIAGSSVLHDLKIVGGGTAGFKAPAQEGSAISARAAKVDSEYKAAAKAHDDKWRIDITSTLLRSFGRVHGLVVGPRGEFSEDLTNLIGLAASAAARRHWADYGEASSSQARARFLRVFTSKIAVAAVRQQAVWMRTRLAQALVQKAGGGKPSQRAKAQRRRAKVAHDEYVFAHGVRSRMRWGRG